MFRQLHARSSLRLRVEVSRVLDVASVFKVCGLMMGALGQNKFDFEHGGFGLPFNHSS